MNKKRIISILTVVMLVMAMATCVFATEGSAPATDPSVSTDAVTSTDTTVEGETAKATQSAPWYAEIIGFLPMILIILVFYFVLIRPESKRKKETAKMRESLAKGDEVTTIGGIIGTITKVKDDEIIIETGSGNDKSKIRFTKWAISSVNAKSEDSDKKSKSDLEEDIKEDAE